MGNANFTFVMGSRTCIGKNISLLEIHKIVPTILLRFEVSGRRERGHW
jgi:cytochrome P450